MIVVKSISKSISHQSGGDVLKKQGIFNSQIASAVSSMGHKDILTIVDMGYPIPDIANKCDLVVDKGSPRFLDVVRMILKELAVEKVILTNEMRDEKSNDYQEIQKIFKDKKFEYISHEKFKEVAHESKIYIRSGEVTPYSNIMLVSEVIF
jgi:D-ribose pyranase